MSAISGRLGKGQAMSVFCCIRFVGITLRSDKVCSLTLSQKHLDILLFVTSYVRSRLVLTERIATDGFVFQERIQRLMVDQREMKETYVEVHEETLSLTLSGAIT